VPSHDPAVQLQNLSLQHPQLDAESSDTGARLIDTVASDPGRRFRPTLQPTADDTSPSPSRAIAYPGGHWGVKSRKWGVLLVLRRLLTQINLIP